MNTVIGKDDIDSIAARWVMRMDRAPLGDAEQRDLDAWLDADARHRGAFVRAQAIWCDMDRVSALGAGELVAATRPRWFAAAGWSRAASVAACVLALAASIGVSNHYFAGRESTDRGETRRLVLDDGSALALNTQSVLQVKYDDEERRIILRHGEATFQVAHDQQRPFVVQAGDVSVRAVGTAFNVRMKPEGVEVTVTEGVVDILRSDDPQKAVRRVHHNEEVIAHAWQPIAPEALSVEPLSDEVIGRRLAWQQGRLIFQGERLAAAIEEVNRYSSNTVVIHDSEIAQKVFVGTFKTGDARGFAHAAAAAFNLRVVEQDGILHLTQ